MPLKTLLASACLLVLLGCGERRVRGRGIPIDEVPETVLKAAKAKLPDVDFDSAWIEKDGDKDAYEISGHNREAKIRDVKVSASGEILEVD
jgi:hypothetical protein